ncbi:hypothetical protein [Dysgonomonas macrotermitis]|uniref:Uncharacterized protein n=1 Tax=Dysgonomonas macrotermitis TaxID=1346286 RepID=A0A1M4YHN1_9BACT|nr:hypothetical protein [Dysgonomonas macrotermitis]SHF05344.1 hypothetical protein SAMN05444362_103177 [Dysgonomonas macrotermitis]
MVPIDENEKLLLQHILQCGGAFLEAHKEFYPFGMAMGYDFEIYTIAASDGNEFPNSQDLISLLEKILSSGINEGNYLLCAICYDIYLKETINGMERKRDAIKICFIANDHKNEVVLPYIFTSEGIIFE